MIKAPKEKYTATQVIASSKVEFEQGQAQLALQVLDVLFKQEPENIKARKLHLKILEKLCEEDYCLMSRNTWVYFMEKDREFLESKGVQ